MVSAAVAEVTATRITVYNMNRRVGDYRARGDELAAPAAWKTHGINLDEADDQLGKLGWTNLTWIWHENGGFYKAVVIPLDHPSLKVTPRSETPEQVRAGNMAAFGNPEGRRWTPAEARARAAQVKATGSTQGWEKRL